MNNCWRLYLLTLLMLGNSLKVNAQITPDDSVGTTVTPNQVINNILSDRINGGEIRDSNLFHSFGEFNIDAGRGVYFTNPDGISNIFSRVTGVNPSHINGTLGVLGNANLFLMNPNGIVFGAGAALDLKGSFLGTTASSINFADGTQFITGSGGVSQPLLTVSIPIGLGFGSNPWGIKVENSGHRLTFSSLFTPIGTEGTARGLQTQAGNTLALIGGEINFNGGILTADSGRLEIGSVASGKVSIAPANQGWMFDYNEVSRFQNINLGKLSLINISGFNGGNIQLRGTNILFTDSSVALIQNYGNQRAGNIDITASDAVTIHKRAPNAALASFIMSEAIGTGGAGNVNISARSLILQGGGSLISKTFNTGSGGEVNIQAQDLVDISGVSIPGGLPGAINSFTVNSGDAGNVTIDTRKLQIRNFGSIGAITAGSGDAGNVIINATDAVELGNPDIFSANEPKIPALGNINSNANNTGNAGNIIVNTPQLILRNGSAISTSTYSVGNAGKITINASQSLEITGKQPNIPTTTSSIRAASLEPNLVVRLLFRIPPGLKGEGGEILINTPELKINNGAQLTVKNEGIGEGGTLRVNANSITLNQQGNITASTASGEGGNIFLNAQSLLMRYDSQISATAGGTGNGGNINIEAGAIAQLEGSKISANAGLGKGGNITINTQGIFQSPESTITATSDVGIDGVINISTPDIKQENALQEQSNAFINTDQVVASSCLANRNVTQGRFVVTGNGGLAQTPDGNLEIPFAVLQVLPTKVGDAVKKTVNSTSNPVNKWKIGDPIQEANQLVTTNDGKLLLVSGSNLQATICQAN